MSANPLKNKPHLGYPLERTVFRLFALIKGSEII